MRIGFVAGLSCIGALCLVAQTAADDQYAPVSMTAAQLLAKVDAASGSLVSGSYLISKRVVGEGWSSTRTTQIVGPNSITIEQDGPLTDSWGVNGGQNWYRDENGVVRIQSGFHDTQDPNALAWRHVADPSYGVRVLGLTQTSPQEYVVEANPPGGQDEYVYVNAKTFLIDKDVTFGVDRLRHVTAYTDYRTVFGETISFDRVSTDGNPADEIEVRTLSFSPTPTVDPAIVALPQMSPMFYVSSPVTLPAKFTHDDGVVVSVGIGGQTLDFTLDSGSTDLYMADDAAQRLGAHLVDGEFVAKNVTIGNLTLPRVVFDTGTFAIEGDSEAHVVGLIGCDILASAVVGFNFKKHTVTLYPWATFNPRAMGLSAIPMQVDDCVPRVAASFAGVPGSFLLDTGAYGTLLYHHYLDRLANVHPENDPDSISSEDQAFESVNGDVSFHYYDVNDFIFAGIKYLQGQVVVPDRTQTFQDPDYDGIIGRNVLKEYEFYLDYNDGVLFFKPNI
jgi:hypothetical protein